MTRFLVLLFCVYCCLFFACTKVNIPDCQEVEESLHEQYTFQVGVAVDMNLLEFHPEYTELVSSQYNSITPGNAFKPDALQPLQGLFEWSEADRLVAYCKDQHKRLHGHTLIWHNQLPNWMNQFQGSPEAWDSLMKTHIQTVVRHFQGQVSSWDVINEAFEDNGDLRENIWLENIGESYLEKAFRYAQEADSTVLLFYNDYNLVAKDKKREAVLDWMDGLREKGIRVDGIGMQFHIGHTYPRNTAIEKALEEVADQGYSIHISELDISVNLLGRNMPEPSENRLNKQAEKYAFVFEAYQQIPQEYQYGISIWGVGDADSWIPSFFSRDDYPLIFDENYAPKPAYCLLMGE